MSDRLKILEEEQKRLEKLLDECKRQQTFMKSTKVPDDFDGYVYKEFCGYLGCEIYVTQGYCEYHKGLACLSCGSESVPRKLPDNTSACRDCVKCHECGGSWSVGGKSTWYYNDFAICEACVLKKVE